MRTYDNDDTLPRLPLPALDDTCARFVASCAPLLTPDELAATEAAVAEFLQSDGAGPRLHAALSRYAEQDGVHSWLDAFWPDQYLSRRDSVAVNVNFFALFEDCEGVGAAPRGFQVERAARLVAAATEYKLRLDDESLAPIVHRGVPQSMVQFRSLFATTRIPGPEIDSIRAPDPAQAPGSPGARHIVVCHRGNFFRMDVLHPDGRPYPADALATGIRSVMAAGAQRMPPERSVGYLTTSDRGRWAADRSALRALGQQNVVSLDLVETALFFLCLEDTTPVDPVAACAELLHGDGGNRWFDKSFSLIVFADGRAGLNGEHSELDGVTALAFVDAIVADSLGHAESVSETDSAPEIEAIEFVLDAPMRAHVLDAVKSFAQLADTASAISSIDGFGADRAKQLGVSPDAFVQMAFQLAHQRSMGRLGSTYESIAMRHFRRGRTEALRVVTPEVVRFVAAMDDPDADAPARRTAFRAAAEQHAVGVRRCQNGQAPERHLAELQRIQLRQGSRLGVLVAPSLYQSPGWLALRDEFLSTSTVPATHVQFLGFGPTGSNCIGIGYRLTAQRLSLYLSAPHSHEQSLRNFVARLDEAVIELEHLLAEGDSRRAAA